MQKFLTICCLALTILSACKSENARDTDNSVTVAGSTTVTPVMRALSDAFMEQTGTRIEVQELGTSAGINATLQGISDIAMASRAVSESELEQGIIPIPIAIDGIAIVVHPTNPVTDLTADQIRSIFLGEITNWSQVGGNDANITVVSREEGSGIRGSFEGFIDLSIQTMVNGEYINISGISRTAIIQQGTGAIINHVSSNINAIGYITAGIATDAVTAISVDGVPLSEEAIRGGAYAFANTFYIGVRESVAGNAQEFIDFIISPAGQDVVSTTGYVRINVR